MHFALQQLITRKAMTLALCLVPCFATATITETFYQHIDVIRDSNGNIDMLKIKSQNPIDFHQFTNQFFSAAIRFQTQQKSFQSLTPPTFAADLGLSPAEQSEIEKQAELAMRNTDFRAIYQSAQFQNVINAFDAKLKGSVFEFATIASLHDSSFFYRAQWRADLIKWAADIAGNFPGVGVASYLFEKAIDDLLDRRSYYQNMTLHFLQEAGPSSLGIGEDEAALIRSSLYEANLDWYNFGSHHDAQKDWVGFGQKAYQEDLKTCQDRLAGHRNRYTSVGTPVDFAFYPVTRKGHDYMINVRDRSSKINGSPSLAYVPADPHLLRNQRLGYELFLFGLNLAPIAMPVQMAASWAIKASFIPQIHSEGALFAHYETEGNGQAARTLVEQTVNLFLMSDF